MHQSTLAVARALGIEFAEPKGWTCCGATAATRPTACSLSLPAANLTKVQDMRLDMVVNCAACYSRMKVANHEIATNPQKAGIRCGALEQDYDGSVKVRHFVEILIEDVGLAAFKKALTQSLRASRWRYYGCLLVRPPEVTEFDDPENPVYLDRLVDAMGGESLDWPCKVECCGGARRCRGRISWSSSPNRFSTWRRIQAPSVSPWPAPCARSTSICGSRTSTRPPAGTMTCRSSTLPSSSGFAWVCRGELGFDKLMVSPKAAMDHVRSSVRS